MFSIFSLPQNLRSPQMPLFSPDPPILMNEGETGQLKRCTYIREAF